jgi:hypothetical protein
MIRATGRLALVARHGAMGRLDEVEGSPGRGGGVARERGNERQEKGEMSLGRGESGDMHEREAWGNAV